MSFSKKWKGTLFSYWVIGVFFTDRWAAEGREPSFIPLYHFHLPTNIQVFIYSFAREVTITYFQSQRFYLQHCYSMRFTTLSSKYLIDWWCDVDFRFFACWFDFSFCYSYLKWEKPVESNSHQLSSLYYKWTINQVCKSPQPTNQVC